jgi:hypothetical protein
MRRKNPTVTAASPSYTRRVHSMRLVGWCRMGPVYLTRTVYVDGRQSWGVSEPGFSWGLGGGVEGARRAKAYIRDLLAESGQPIPEGVPVYVGGWCWIGGRAVEGRYDARGNWKPLAAA